MKTLSLHSPGLLAFGILADSINDASSTRKVYLLAGGLAVLGIALLVVTVWFWRSTRPEPALFAPLEVMGERKFRQLDAVAQQELLDSVRPEEAQPLRWGTVHGEPIEEPVIDLEAAARAELVGFDDLRDPSPAQHEVVAEDPLLSVIAAAADAAHEELMANDEPETAIVAPVESEADQPAEAEDADVGHADQHVDNEDADVWRTDEPALEPAELAAHRLDFDEAPPVRSEPAPRVAPFIRADASAALGTETKADPPLAHELMDPLLRNRKKGRE